MNTNLFYLFSLLTSLWFVEPVWYFYWARFATYTQIGIIFAVMTVTWVLFEIPSGIFADRYGRKTAVIIGGISLAFGSWILAASQGVWWLVFGGLFHNIGRAFISGALEALAYDSLKAEKREHDFDRILSKRTQITIIGFAVSTVIGGLLYGIHFRLPHILMAISATFAVLVSFLFREPRYRQDPNVDNALQTGLSGMKQLMKPSLRLYTTPAIVLLTLFFMFDWGFSKPAIAVNNGFFAKEQGIIYALLSVVTFFMVGFLPKLRKKTGDINGLLLLIAVMGVGYGIGSLKLGYLGVIPLLLLSQGSGYAESWISAVVNTHIESKYRATALSGIQFAGRIPFNIITILVGNAVDRGHVNQFHMVVGIGSICFALFMFLRVIPRKIASS